MKMTKQMKANRRLARVCDFLNRNVAERNRLWQAACAADGVEPSSTFVIFSKTPEAAAYNDFMRKALAVR